MTILQSLSNSPTFNLSAEEYLFSQRCDELIFLYVNEPCVIIGSNQVLENEVDVEFCKENDIQVLRRISGGGAVYHDTGNLNYCFISNRVTGRMSLDTEFLNPIIAILTELHIDVHQGIRKDLWLPLDSKISGTASHVSKTRELHHGTLLYDSDLYKLKKSLSPKTHEQRIRSIASVQSPVENICSYLKEHNHFAPDAKSFFELFIKKLLDIYCTETVSELSREEISMIKPLYSLI